MKRILSAFISFMLIIVIGLSQVVSATPIGKTPAAAEGEKAKRTILLYICGADLEEDYAMATYNLKQVLNARFSADEDVRCVVMTVDEITMITQRIAATIGFFNIGVPPDRAQDQPFISSSFCFSWPSIRTISASRFPSLPANP